MVAARGYADLVKLGRIDHTVQGAEPAPAVSPHANAVAVHKGIFFAQAIDDRHMVLQPGAVAHIAVTVLMIGAAAHGRSPAVNDNAHALELRRCV